MRMFSCLLPSSFADPIRVLKSRKASPHKTLPVGDPAEPGKGKANGTDDIVVLDALSPDLPAVHDFLVQYDPGQGPHGPGKEERGVRLGHFRPKIRRGGRGGGDPLPRRGDGPERAGQK